MIPLPGYPIVQIACFVDSMDDTIAHFAQRGFPLASRARTTGGVEFSFVDTRAALGHMVEIYQPAAALTDFYGFVRDSARAWDGRDAVRSIELP